MGRKKDLKGCQLKVSTLCRKASTLCRKCQRTKKNAKVDVDIKVYIKVDGSSPVNTRNPLYCQLCQLTLYRVVKNNN